MTKLLCILLLPLLCCKSKVEATEKSYDAFHAEAAKFCHQHDMETAYYFLVDLGIHSGKPRFFIYDFNQKKIIDKNLVTHGACDAFGVNPDKWEKAKYSNKVDSHCSAKGKYRIGKRDSSAWGIGTKYWLHGLEDSNSNAEKRVIVLHSWDAVADTDIAPEHSPLSWGCPAVSNQFMEKLDTRLKDTKKPVLLWITE